MYRKVEKECTWHFWLLLRRVDCRIKEHITCINSRIESNIPFVSDPFAVMTEKDPPRAWALIVREAAKHMNEREGWCRLVKFSKRGLMERQL